MPVRFHELGEPYHVAVKPFLHQCLEVGPAMEHLAVEDVCDIVVTALNRVKLVGHVVAAGTTNNMTPKHARTHLSERRTGT